MCCVDRKVREPSANINKKLETCFDGDDETEKTDEVFIAGSRHQFSKSKISTNQAAL